MLVQRGWLQAEAFLGEGRAIVEIAHAGDIVLLGAQSARQNFDVVHNARTDAALIGVSSVALEARALRDTGFAAQLWRTAADAHAASLITIALMTRMDVRRRVATLLMGLAEQVTPENDVRVVALPFSQEDIADMMGVSIVHINRVLRRLERDSIMSFRTGKLHLIDRARARRLIDGDVCQR